MTLTTKVGAGALFASTIASLGAAGGRHLRQEEPKINTVQQTTKISTLIEERYDYIILSTKGAEDNSYWDTNWDNYKQDSLTNDKDIFGLKSWTKENTPDLKEELKEKCSLLAETSILINDDKTYENFAKYCARSVTIKDQAGKERLKIVSTSDPNEFSIFGKKADAKGTLNEELKALKVAVGSLSDAYKIRDACRDIVTTDKKDKEYTNIFSAYKKVCTK